MPQRSGIITAAEARPDARAGGGHSQRGGHGHGGCSIFVGRGIGVGRSHGGGRGGPPGRPPHVAPRTTGAGRPPIADARAPGVRIALPGAPALTLSDITARSADVRPARAAAALLPEVPHG